MQRGFWLAGFILIAVCGCEHDAPKAALPTQSNAAAPNTELKAALPQAAALPAPQPEAFTCSSVDEHDLVLVIRCFYVIDAPLDLSDKWHWLTAEDQKQSTEAEWAKKMTPDPAKPPCVSAEITLIGDRDRTLPGEKLVSRRVHCPSQHTPAADKIVTDTWVNEAGRWRWRQGAPEPLLK